MRIKVRLKQLKSPEAQYVSLVKRSASQIPFRIQKASEETMGIDLSSLKRVFKADKGGDAGEVAAVVVQKGEDLPQVKEVIRKAGFDVSRMTENADGTVMFAQGKSVDGSVVRMDGNVLLVVKNAPDHVVPYANAVGSEGYVDGLIPGTAALVEVIRKAASSARTPGELKSAIHDIVQKYADFAMGVAESVPPQAYQVSAEIARVKKAGCVTKAKKKEGEPDPAKADPTAPAESNSPQSNATATTPQNMQTDPEKKDGTTAEAGSEGEMTEEEKKKKALAEKEAAAGKNTTVVDGPGSITGGEGVPNASGSTADAVAGKTSLTSGTGKGTNGEVDAFSKGKAAGSGADATSGKTGLTGGTAGKTQSDSEVTVQKMDAVLSGLGKLTELVGGLSSRIERVEKSAEETANKLKSTVAAPPRLGDTPTRVEVKKSDDDDMGEGFWDSAMARRR